MPGTSTPSCTVSEASIARLKQIAWPQAAAHAACRPPAFRVRSRDVRLEPAAITLCRNGRLLRTTTCSRAFGRRDRGDTGGPPAVSRDGMAPGPPRQLRIGRSLLAGFFRAQSARLQDGQDG